MFRLVSIDLKRLFSNRTSLLLVILAPVISLALLASFIAPLFFSNKLVSHIQVAIFVEDLDPDLQMVIERVGRNEQVTTLIDLLMVDSTSEGVAAVQDGGSAIFIQIPAKFVNNLYNRRASQVEIWISPEYSFESAILMPVVVSVQEGFNGIQTGLDVVYLRMLDDFTPDQALELYDQLIYKLGGMLLNRKGVFNVQGISPLGRLLPLEYYISAIFAFFIALGVVPLSGYNASDFSSAALSRGLASTRWRYKYLIARILSGMVYLLIVSLPMLAVGSLIYGQDVLYTGSYTALLGVLFLSALCFSTAAVFLALLFSRGDTSVWVGFYFILVSALAGGVVFPENFLPDFLSRLGFVSPVRASMNGFAAALFDYNPSNLLVALLILLGWFGLGLAASLPLFNQRVRS